MTTTYCLKNSECGCRKCFTGIARRSKSKPKDQQRKPIDVSTVRPDLQKYVSRLNEVSR
jgi:hypothetical protein